ncbi:histidine utilization repressor [Sneathiella sp.]|jgi:GntR family histidine utilization transcriptional repressor|uniref:histidine utilization repressor n=1 Tax=Sneathiella sp. TaxID=1964365 RepID=UPI0039E26148
MTSNALNFSPDADPSEPLYKQIKRLIVSRIDSGQWKPGDKIPTEHRLVKELDASRMTVNRALRELTQENILVRRQGSGTFVSPARLETGLLEIRNIAEDIVNRGNEHSCKVLVLEEVSLQEEMAALMGCPITSENYHSVCLHLENGTPVQLEDRYVNKALVPDFLNQDFSRQTTGGYLLSNIAYTHAEHKISAAIATNDQHSSLELSENEPVLVLQRRTYCSNGVITVVNLYHPSSRFEFAGTFIPDRN